MVECAIARNELANFYFECDRYFSIFINRNELALKHGDLAIIVM